MIVLTGASNGIGAAAAIELARRGHGVLAVGRSERNLIEVVRRARRAAPGETACIDYALCDFAHLDQVRRLAETIGTRRERIFALVNNAGMQASGRETNADGCELTFVVNHLAPFLLTMLLLPRLERDGSRIVTTASSNHASGSIDLDDLAMANGWSSAVAYDRSKLANVLFTLALSRRTTLPVSCFHPGSITTALNRESPTYRLEKLWEWFIYASPTKGAETLIYLASAPEAAHPGALYFENCHPAAVRGLGNDEALAEKLFVLSERLVAIDARLPLPDR